MPSKKATMMNALATRLGTITTANGYDTNVAQVFHNEIPMGLDLDEHELPAIFVIGSDDSVEHKQQWVFGDWVVELQLLHKDVSDSTMHDFVRDIAKAIYANSPTAEKRDAWRSFHPSLYEVRLLEVEEDLNTIEANRFFVVKCLLRYQTSPYDL